MQNIDIFFLLGLVYIIQTLYVAIRDMIKKKKDETDYNIGSYMKMETGQGVSFIKKHVNSGCIFTFLYFGWIIAGFWTDQKPLFIALALMPVLTLVVMQGKKQDSKQGKVIMTIDFILNKLLILAIVFKHFYFIF